MAIKNYPNETDYKSATKPIIESQVAMIETKKEVKYDGVNVITDTPQAGDPVFLDENNKPVVISAATLIKATITDAWTYVGEVIETVDNNHIRIIHKDISQTRKWLDVCQYAWTDVVLTGEETTKTIGIRCALDWSANTEVKCIYTATALAEAAEAMQRAIEHRLGVLNATIAEIALWHCYADKDNNRVIVQRDSCSDYRFYNCSGLTHITWGNMPSNDFYFKINNKTSNYRGLQNIAKGESYWSTNGRTLLANVDVGSEAGNTDPMKLSEYNTSPYAAAIRAYYPTYKDYLYGEFSVKFPQKLGVFNLPDGKSMCDKYGTMTVPTKTGGTKVKFPALNWPLGVGYNADGLRQGDWHLWDVREGTIIMRDETLAKINTTRQKMGATRMSVSTSRWWAERYSVIYAWLFNGYSGYLNNYNVNSGYQVGAVTLLKFKD